MSDSPAAILFDVNGSPLTTVSGVAGVSLTANSIYDAIDMGLVAGARVAQAHGFVGVNTAADRVPVRFGTYVEPPTAAQRSIGSTNANDTAAGTGARKVKLTYYDGSLNGPYEETVTLNGTTAVDTVATDIRFIEGMEVVEVGSTGSNQGLIVLRNGTGGAGPTRATIPATYMNTFWAHHYVPTGQRAIIKNLLWGMANGDSGNILLRYRNPLDANSAYRYKSTVSRIEGSSPTLTHPLNPPLVVEGPALLEMVVSIDSSTAGLAVGGFGYYEV